MVQTMWWSVLHYKYTNKNIPRIRLKKKNKKGNFAMQDAKIYLSTAPVLATLWFGFLAGLLIEINRFFPDALVLPFL